MSLLHHVSSIEGIDRERAAPAEEPAKAVRRELNYDLFPLPEEEAKDQSVDVAYEVSTTKRIGKLIAWATIVYFCLSWYFS